MPDATAIEGAPPSPRSQQCFRRGLRIGQAAVLTFLFVELILRLTGIGDPRLYTLDAQRGQALRPHAEGWWRQEGGAYIRINGAGMRDREHMEQKPPNTFRIAVLGDSYAEALQVPQEAAFWAVLERELASCPALDGQAVEVLNFGVSGYGTAQELQTLRYQVWPYVPDLILLAFTTGNDVIDNAPALSLSVNRPYFVYREGRLELDESFRTSDYYRSRTNLPAQVYYTLLDYSQTLQALAGLKARFDQAETVALQDDTAPGGKPKTDGTAAALYREPTDPRWQDAWHVTEGLVSLVGAEVASHGRRFLVVTLSNGVQVLPDAGARQAFLARVGGQDLFYPDRRIAALGQRQGIDVLTLAPALADYAVQQQVFLHGFDGQGQGHWNATGHLVAGRLIAAHVCAELAAAGPLP